ncbi:hypothetical protein [Streptomyces flaveolus]|uniref:hypothetical protein n=1 Tax=Streptomyces flaveolus TaxID=67297 RepID=UPI0033256185
MTEDVTAVRLRLAKIVAQAETDEAFRTRLAEYPESVLAEYQIPDTAVTEYSQALARARTKDLGGASPECVHTDGCADFTCISSNCGPTCYVTIPVAAPDA